MKAHDGRPLRSGIGPIDAHAEDLFGLKITLAIEGTKMLPERQDATDMEYGKYIILLR